MSDADNSWCTMGLNNWNLEKYLKCIYIYDILIDFTSFYYFFINQKFLWKCKYFLTYSFKKLKIVSYRLKLFCWNSIFILYKNKIQDFGKLKKLQLYVLYLYISKYSLVFPYVLYFLLFPQPSYSSALYCFQKEISFDFIFIYMKV